jgi:hypothetical protein
MTSWRGPARFRPLGRTDSRPSRCTFPLARAWLRMARSGLLLNSRGFLAQLKQ